MRILRAFGICAGAAVAVGTILLCIPRTDVVAPKWDVRVVDDEGRPLSSAHVTENWQQYTLEREGHSETVTADADGWAEFPTRTITANGFQRIGGAFVSAMGGGVHASFGSYANVYADADGYGTRKGLAAFIEDEKASRSNGSSTQMSVVVRQRCPVGYMGFECSMQRDSDNPNDHPRQQCSAGFSGPDCLPAPRRTDEPAR